MKPRLLFVCSLLAVMAAALTGQIAAPDAASRTVTLKDITFSPTRLAVSKGTTVTFRWRDDGTSHDVTSVGKKRFASIGARETGRKPVRFTRAGTYRYVCTLHPGMAGRIIVR